MSAPEYALLVTRQARLDRFREKNAPDHWIIWAERLVAESELLAAVERIVLEAHANMGLGR